jgi:enoyl-CoA hydratase/3-hydroxyacyl-CoA dehydrogenase
MGHGIAELITTAEHNVYLMDVSDELVNEGYERIEWSLEKLEQNGVLDTGDAAAAAERIKTFSQLDSAVADADIIIEAVPEDLGLKRRVFANANDAAPEATVFASNTSTISDYRPLGGDRPPRTGLWHALFQFICSDVNR